MLTGKDSLENSPEASKTIKQDIKKPVWKNLKEIRNLMKI
jgi:hypothetical protein